MITVYRKNFTYKFDGKTGVIINTKNNFKIVLNQWDVIECNKSNNYIDMMIEVNECYLGK